MGLLRGVENKKRNCEIDSYKLIRNEHLEIQGELFRQMSFDTFCDSYYLEENLFQNTEYVNRYFYIGDKKKITVDRKGRMKGCCNITLIPRETTINELHNLKGFELHVLQEDVDNNFEIIKNKDIRTYAQNGWVKVVITDVQ